MSESWSSQVNKGYLSNKQQQSKTSLFQGDKIWVQLYERLVWYHEYARFNEPRFLHCTPQQDSQCNYGNGTTNMRRLSRLRRVHPDKDGVLDIAVHFMVHGTERGHSSHSAMASTIDLLTGLPTDFEVLSNFCFKWKQEKHCSTKNQYMNKRNNPKKGQRRLLNNSIYRQKIEKKDK